MHAAALESPSETAPPTLEPDPDDPITWARRQLSWERRLDALREASAGREARHLRSCASRSADE
jgi:hypothetical protein